MRTIVFADGTFHKACNGLLFDLLGTKPRWVTQAKRFSIHKRADGRYFIARRGKPFKFPPVK